MKASLVLGGRAIREALRTPDSLLPTMFIPLFFLIVNIGQASKQFKGADFLFGQGYAAFQLPASLLLSASFGSAALYLTEEIEGGYFDKLRATPISRTALVLGRLYAEVLKSGIITALMIVISMLFGVRVKSGILGFLMLMIICGLWAVVFSGFMQLVSLKTRSAAATQGASMVFFPLLFVTPNFVPRDRLTRAMEIAATINPVTYVMEATRSLILQGFEWSLLGKGFLVIGIALALMLFLSIRMVNSYD
jgi:ABC-2 type transport system permease protein